MSLNESDVQVRRTSIVRKMCWRNINDKQWRDS